MTKPAYSTLEVIVKTRNVLFLITQMIEVIHPAVRSATRCLAAFGALALICATGLAQSPERAGGGSTSSGGGTIYYLGPWDGATHNTAVMRAMNSDGTNNRQLGFGPQGNPSIALHGGHRWFLIFQQMPGVYNPYGTQRYELFAMRDDDDNQNNNPVTRVQLTYDIDLQLQGSLHWVLGDQ